MANRLAWARRSSVRKRALECAFPARQRSDKAAKKRAFSRGAQVNSQKREKNTNKTKNGRTIRKTLLPHLISTSQNPLLTASPLCSLSHLHRESSLPSRNPSTSPHFNFSKPSVMRLCSLSHPHRKSSLSLTFLAGVAASRSLSVFCPLLTLNKASLYVKKRRFALRFRFKAKPGLIALHETIDSVRERGEKLDSLVQKSLDLSAASQALHIFIDALLPAWGAILISCSLILAFGEIIPQAVWSWYGLCIAARQSPLVRLLLITIFPISYPNY
nr:DUF21 domain-containing protein At5g52790 [Ipomoea batatas]